MLKENFENGEKKNPDMHRKKDILYLKRKENEGGQQGRYSRYNDGRQEASCTESIQGRKKGNMTGKRRVERRRRERRE